MTIPKLEINSETLTYWLLYPILFSISGRIFDINKIRLLYIIDILSTHKTTLIIEYHEIEINYINFINLGYTALITVVSELVRYKALLL